MALGYSGDVLKFFESGFLAINFSGTGTTGQVIYGAQDITLGVSVDVQELSTLDLQFSKIKRATGRSWTLSGNGIFLTLSGETYHWASGDTHIVGGKSADYILEAIKTSQEIKCFMKISAGNYQTFLGYFSSFELSATTNEQINFSFEIAVSGDPVKSLT